ncbi:MAG: endonuclease [Saprospiraceae bacterium]|nr:endonuclease [Saprospiraceae bacterium]
MRRYGPRILHFLIATFTTTGLAGQEIFPGLTDQALLEALVATYKPASVLSLSQAKDTLYGKIDLQQDSVHGIYTGFAVHVPAGQDPSQAVFLDGNGINLEHSWPQAKGAGAGTQGHSDMHHLFPSRVAVNSARGSNPFADIPDQVTTMWFYRDQVQTSIPGSNADAFSEATKTLFEPRETVKGDIARAAFYFYTMYQADADAADPQWFSLQRATFLQWHAADPVDTAELARSNAIAAYQDGRENPYVLDPTLAERAFCDAPPCATTSVQATPANALAVALRLDGCQLYIGKEDSTPGSLRCMLYDTAGKLLRVAEGYAGDPGSVSFNVCGLVAGAYVVVITPFGDNWSVTRLIWLPG